MISKQKVSGASKSVEESHSQCLLSGDDMRDAQPSFKGASARARPPAPAPEPKPLAAHLLIASLSLSRTRAGRHHGTRSQDAVDGGGNRTSARLYLRSLPPLPPLPNVEREGRSNKNYRGNEGGAGGSRRISRRASASSLPCCSSGSQKNTRLNNILIPETPRVACR